MSAEAVKTTTMQEENDDIMELPGSELGTKEYWDKSYQREIENYKSHGDVGEVWFDEDSQVRVINWILSQSEIDRESRIVDLGSGNGMLLIELAREGFRELVGLDYSENAIDLAQNIANDQDLKINYYLADILDENLTKFGKFLLVHDKGTYDAISLHPENAKEKREKYIRNVYNILEEKGFFIITSCNWTEEELTSSLISQKLYKFHTIPTPTFKFGGKIGSVVTSIVFKKMP